MGEQQTRDRAAAPRLSLVVPVYNSADLLPELYRRISAAMAAIDSHFECLFVDDGSADPSWLEIEKLARADGRVRGFRMARNFGQHNAVLAGIRAARGEIIVTLDDDLQNPPEEISKLLAKLEQEMDVVYGKPDQETHGFLRNMASRITKYALSLAMGAETARNVSAFRAFRTRLREAFADYRGPTVNIDVLLTWGTTRFGAVTVIHQRRATGRSGYSFRKLFSHTFNMITGFTTLPLQIGSLVGLLFASLGVVILAFVLGRYVLQGSEVPGFTFLASLLAIFFGATMFLLGIFGEYLARMHLGSMGRPPYLIADSTIAGQIMTTPNRREGDT